MGRFINKWAFKVIPLQFAKDIEPDDSKKEMNLEHVGKMFRKIYYALFRRRYMSESLKRRKGACKACGCCKVSWLFSRCRYFDKKNGLCLLWKEKGFEALPYFCRIYPFDESDKCEYSKEHCGYYW